MNTPNPAPSLLDQPEIQAILAHIVHNLTPDFHLRQDLRQEALIHLWKEETHHPGHAPNWYIHGCRNYLKNRLRMGKSIDSPKRGDHACLIDDALEDTPRQDDALVAGSFLPSLIARDAAEQLSRRLTMVRPQLLILLRDGFTPSEIALELGMTPRAVNQNCRAIAAEAAHLDVRAAW